MPESEVLRVAGRVRESIVDGPGLRYALFTQGCPHRCAGCHNEHTWPMDGGEDMTVDDVIAEIQKDPLLQGVTLTGGEPFAQAGPLTALARRIHTETGLNIWVYSGYTWEELTAGKDTAWRALLLETDVLADGRFEIEQKTYGLRFRGSRNQRLIDVPRSLDAGEVVLWA